MQLGVQTSGRPNVSEPSAFGAKEQRAVAAVLLQLNALIKIEFAETATTTPGIETPG